MLEKNAKRVKLHDIRGDILSKLVNCCYTLQIALDISYVVDILIAAHLFGLNDVVVKCEKYCQAQIGAPNAFDYLALSQIYSLVNLRHAAHEYTRREFKTMVEHQSFLELSIDRVVEYLEDDSIMVDSEEDIFKAAVDWIDEQRSERRKYYPRLMDTVRMSKIDYQVCIY